MELSTDVTFYTNNGDFFGGNTIEQDPIYGALSHWYSSCLLRLMRASCAKRINAKPRKHVAMMKSNPAP
jgi:hypothetical protein